ncbi:MAG TPA: HAMP domain-containing sensor histidine kinase [Ramlibacter sp.]|uniref:sensor histidine kinase n=1 Tax=Ramlibacter sp. TaxID=1917967 RepID=UPI002D80B03F|nr:HAMP domain-containing sensor histidine kinase [Ramlibacter sp.]HET8745453.1 HAMP domain-containing sensor histidine kinase [Ramlibacter sp.]
MKPETLPAPATSAERDWVEGELVRSLMRTQRSTQWLALMLVAIVVGILSDDNEPERLGAWVGVWLLVAAWRLWVIHQYRTRVASQPTEAHLAFFRRNILVWPVSALVWGLTTELYFDRSPLGDQYICWLIMAGLAMFSINSLSARLGVMRAYLDILAGSALAVMAWRMFVELELQGPAYHWWVAMLLLIFWQVLRHAGARLHETLRRNFELQYRNMQLIESLTRQTQAALDAVEIKNRFLASAAHDIRQPVHALGLYADWLRGEPELVNELAPKIVAATKAVNHLFDSLFDLARLDSGKVRLNVEPVDLSKLLHNLELQYLPLCEAKGLEFRMRVCPGTVRSDPILLQRIVGNLISNAIKYTEKGGVLVASRCTRAGLRVEIWDTGVGIPQSHQREIFREFYKVPGHGGTEEGFGLGLYIVARLSHILGHPLSFHSRVGRGTVFRVLLQPTDPREAGERAVATMAQMFPGDVTGS